MSPDIADKRRAFAALHQSGCFVIPNPWDAGSARYLQSLGFQALATTSAGFAWSHARADNGITRDMALAHLHEMVAAVDLPINADFENGFAPDAAGVAENVRLAVATGVAGLSIEDSTGDAARPLFTLDEAVERLRAARGAIDRAGGGVMLVGRAECFLVGRPDLAETIARLQAYANAGADCLYAPGVTTREQIVALVEAVAPKPLNLLVGSASELTVADIAALGVRRISVGGALARSAWGGFMRSARMLAQQGRFDGFADAASGKDLNALFSEPGAGASWRNDRRRPPCPCRARHCWTCPPRSAQALAAGRAVVALESTIISHGMPYPQNVATALQVEGEVRAHGAVPATMAVVDGRLKAGLSRAEIEGLGRAGPQRAQAQPARPAAGRGGGPDRRHHRGGDDDHRGAGGHPGVCHRRHRRGAPGRGRELRHLGRSAGAGAHAGGGGLRGREVDPGHSPHAGGAGDPRRAGGGLWHRPAAGLLRARQRLWRRRAAGHAGADRPRAAGPVGDGPARRHGDRQPGARGACAAARDDRCGHRERRWRMRRCRASPARPSRPSCWRG